MRLEKLPSASMPAVCSRGTEHRVHTGNYAGGRAFATTTWLCEPYKILCSESAGSGKIKHRCATISFASTLRSPQSRRTHGVTLTTALQTQLDTTMGELLAGSLEETNEVDFDEDDEPGDDREAAFEEELERRIEEEGDPESTEGDTESTGDDDNEYNKDGDDYDDGDGDGDGDEGVAGAGDGDIAGLTEVVPAVSVVPVVEVLLPAASSAPQVGHEQWSGDAEVVGNRDEAMRDEEAAESAEVKGASHPCESTQEGSSRLCPDGIESYRSPTRNTTNERYFEHLWPRFQYEVQDRSLSAVRQIAGLAWLLTKSSAICGPQ
ncbi:hypothetical protein C8R47DRAFT_264006 [Mycena vitilis]|nr:hypothetical protein C8R47DRAFT_264006 [Mycena vitilis]